VDPSSPQIVAFRRTADGFVREVITGLKGTIPLPEIGCELPLVDVYDGMPFAVDG
jgi:hypothetical protein